VRLLGAPVALAEDPSHDPSGSIYEHGIRMAPHAERDRALPGAIDPDWKPDSEILAEVLHHLSLFLQGDAYDLEAARLELLVERRLGGSLPPAIRSPRRKEAEEDRLAAEIPNANFAAINRGECDVRCRFGRPGTQDAHRLEGIRGPRFTGEQP